MLKLLDITHSYGENTVLDSVSLTLEPGQRIALFGPSGCGKTTLLRIALMLQKPTEGQVSNTFRKTGVVFQEPRLLPWRTAAENVNLVLGDKEKSLPLARECLSQMELQDAWDKYPRELSGGMQQRVALARAMAPEPDLLVLDEPFKGLDEALKLRILQKLQQTQAALLLVTHDLQEAKALDCQVVHL